MANLIFLSITFSSCDQMTYSDKKGEIMRNSSCPINPLILNRWSARAMSGQTVSENELKSLFEAARWAPSSYNNQPWRFLYVTKEDSNWQKMFNLLVPFNQSWTQNAAVLILVLSARNYEHNKEFSKTHSFDAGAATQNLALQGSSIGLVVHVMEGFDYDKARSEFNIPQEYDIEAMIVVGKPGSKEVLPSELQEKETPSDRRAIDDFVFHNELVNQSR